MLLRKELHIDEMKLSYLDSGGVGVNILALHGHFGCGRWFASLAEYLGESYRLTALDQRGHGWSDKTEEYSREAYINDAVKVIHLLKLEPVILIGHSLGGVNAYQLAARFPQLVQGMIIVDIGAITQDDLSFVLSWPQRFPTLQTVNAFFADACIDGGKYFMESLKEYSDGWGFRFRYKDMVVSQQQLNGDWWPDWLGSSCPALLMCGQLSKVLPTKHAREMAVQRPNTRLIEFSECGHNIHFDAVEDFHKAVQEFIDSLKIS
ncbi:MAG: alpha/beta hydrolase [Okeania sp. SIO3B3]|nr:alpha/beta hydrolase [Okeania sp. SIO3B3]